MPRGPRTVVVRDIVGVAETLRIIGTPSRATFARWRKGVGVVERFPRPIRKLKMGELWDAEEVRVWLARNRPPMDEETDE
jgi:hypothetical protein